MLSRRYSTPPSLQKAGEDMDPAPLSGKCEGQAGELLARPAFAPSSTEHTYSFVQVSSPNNKKKSHH